MLDALETPEGDLVLAVNVKEDGKLVKLEAEIRLCDGTYLIGAIANGVLLSRVDKDGNILWRRSLLEQQTAYGGMALTELEDGGYLVASLIQLINGRSYDAILLRTDGGGRVGGGKP